MPGDEVCNVSTFCWTIEDPERFRKKCAQRKEPDDDSMGSYACRQIVATGAFDVYVYRFFDERHEVHPPGQGRAEQHRTTR